MAAKAKPGNDIYQLRAVLRGISPLVWRRLPVRADSSVADLHVDFSIFCPICQQLMSNFSCAVRFSPFPVHRSTASGDILAAIGPAVAPTIDGWAELRPQVGGLPILRDGT